MAEERFVTIAREIGAGPVVTIQVSATTARSTLRHLRTVEAQYTALTGLPHAFTPHELEVVRGAEAVLHRDIAAVEAALAAPASSAAEAPDGC